MSSLKALYRSTCGILCSSAALQAQAAQPVTMHQSALLSFAYAMVALEEVGATADSTDPSSGRITTRWQQTNSGRERLVVAVTGESPSTVSVTPEAIGGKVSTALYTQARSVREALFQMDIIPPSSDRKRTDLGPLLKEGIEPICLSMEAAKGIKEMADLARTGYASAAVSWLPSMKRDGRSRAAIQELYCGRIRVGLAWADVQVAMGKPTRKTTSERKSGTVEIWHYPDVGKALTFANGKLVEIITHEGK